MRSLLVVVSLLFAAADARAECAIRQWVGTADGTRIPASGTLYIHDESLRWSDDNKPVVEYRWIGKPGEVFVHKVEEAVAHVDYVGFAGSTLVITPGYRDEASQFQLVDDWQAPSRAPRVLKYWHRREEWTCSWADSVMVQVDQPTAAIRARWTYGGRTVEWIEPAQTDRTKAVVELGKLDCGGTSIPPEQLADGGELELFAIRFDGSEVRIAGLPRRISNVAMPEDERGLDAAFTIVDASEPPRAAPPPRKQPSPTRIRGAVVLALVGLGLLLAWRSRVRAPTAI